MSFLPTAWRLALVSALTACSRPDHCAKIEVSVLADPDHTAKLAPEAVRRGTGGTYRVHGSSHDHVFSLTAEDMQALELGKSVSVRTSSTNAHVHDVTVRCKD
jgi:hypothetical protein